MPDETDEHDSPVIRELRAKAKRADDLEPENATLRQENAFLKAGLKLDPMQTTALLAVLDGDFSPEAIRGKAEALKFIEGTTPEQEAPQVSQDEVEAHQRMQEATAAAQPSEARVKTLDDELAAAKSQDEVIAILEREGLANVEP